MTTFDPNSITPSDDFMRGLISKTNYRDACVLSARWGAEQAVEALKHQWPEPLMRPVTKEDGDKNGFVQVWFETNGSCFYNLCHWEDVRGRLWLHTASWQPKPEPTLQLQALNILEDSIGNTRGDGWAEISPDNVRKLREALLSIPSDAVGEVRLRTGSENTFHTTWKE
jgi:hypothetical protein